MADYYPLISRAVAGLDKNTGELRRALYERARTALVDQLRGVTPPLSETEITRERLALEEAIRKVETEEAKRIRQEAPRAAERRTTRAEPVQAEDPPAASPEPAIAPNDSAISPPTAETTVHPPGHAPSEESHSATPASAEMAPQIRRPARKRPPESIAGAASAALKNSAASEGGIAAFDDPALQAAEEARKAYMADPRATAATELPEPRLDTDLRRSTSTTRGRAPLAPSLGRSISGGLEPEVAEEAPHHPSPTTRPFDRPPLPDSVRVAAERARQALGDDDEHQPWSRRLLGGFVKIAIGIVLIAVVAATAYWQRHNLLSAARNVASLGRAPSVQQQPADTTPQRSKIPDRIGQGEAAPQAGSTTAPAQGQAEAPVAQRVVLYEEDPNDSAGKQYVGTVVWRTEMVSPGPGQPQDIAVRGDITIPERNMSVTWSLRRNTDKDLPASHTVSIMFTLPADFSHGGISEIRGVLMKQTEQARGVSLAGLSVKVTTGFFLVGLSATDTDVQRNIQLLKDRAWFDIAIVYTDGRRAILAVEKGTPGDRAFTDAFAGWGQ